VKIVGNVHVVHKLPRVNIHKHPLQTSCSLHHASFMSALKCLGIGEVGKPPPDLSGALYILVNIHALQSLVKIKGSKLGLSGSKILGIIHSVIKLVLKSIEVRGSPSYFKAETLLFQVLLVLFQFFRDVHSFDVEFERT